MAAVPLPAGEDGLLLLPDPVGGVLNHGGVLDLGPPQPSGQLEDRARIARPNPSSLEDLCVSAYLKYLENEMVTYVSLTQSKSTLVKGVAKRMLQIVKENINSRLTGLASSVLREKMIVSILSDKFPSPQHCNMYSPETRGEGEEAGDNGPDDTELLVPTCPNTCCTGAFIQEAMMGVVMSAEVRQLVFTSDKVQSRRQFPATLEFNVPLVLTHLLGATDGKMSQLERLVFSENFVKEESETETGVTRRRGLCLDQTDKQTLFSQHFGQGSIYDTPDRRGIAVDLLILFRDIHPKGGQFTKLTELVLKNNIQCKLYSKATFQFEFLARIGYSCPRLRVLDLFGTDTWADCLLALFFKDAFHTLHRYLYFMENEDDECSEYHPHDTSRYCQFCFDQWHPHQIERPYTNNPVIPLLDSVYDHVIKRYPRRSYCILRNCVRVSDLIRSPGDTCFELTRARRVAITDTCPRTSSATCSGQHPSSCKRGQVGPAASTGVRTRLQTRQSQGLFSPQVTGAGAGGQRPGLRRSLRGVSGYHVSSSSCVSPEDRGRRWVMASRRVSGPAQEREASQQPLQVSGKVTSSSSLAKEKEATADSKKEAQGVVTRARKRRMVETSGARIIQKEVTVAKRSRLSARGTPSAGKVLNIVKRDCGQRREETGPRGDGDQAKSGPGVERIEYSDWEGRVSSLLPNIVSSGRVTAREVHCPHHNIWQEPDSITYREIVGYPHLNDCVKSLEILNIGGSNVLGEFIPFLLLHTPKLKSLGQWLNTMIYGLEILKDLPGYENYKNYQLQELSYSSDRNYFCQPYIGFVPESQEFKNVRKEMVRYSNKSAKRVGHKARLHESKRRQIRDDMELMVSTCPNLRKMNLVVHYKTTVVEVGHTWVWSSLLRLQHLTELDLVTMKLENIQSLLEVVGERLQRLTVECDEEQGTGSEIVHIARNCPNITSLRLLLGDKILRGEQTLHFGQSFFRKLDRLTIEGNVHLHGFAFLWGHCQNLKYLRIGLVVSNELTNTNVLIQDVFTLLFQVNKMLLLEEMHIKNLKVRSLAMATLLLDNLPSLKRASNWFVDLYGDDMATFKKHLRKHRARGLKIDYKEW